jgi:thiaminase (transcriptional activator TenA)
VERQLHESLLKDKARIAKAEAAPSSYAYTNHLLVSVHRGTFAEGLAALLPCYWIYAEVGKELRKTGSSDPAYQRWIEQYSDPAYEKSVRQVLDMMNAQAEVIAPAERDRAAKLFLLSARYEYLFWDAAWREEAWLP